MSELGAGLSRAAAPWKWGSESLPSCNVFLQERVVFASTAHHQIIRILLINIYLFLQEYFSSLLFVFTTDIYLFFNQL